MPPLPVRRFTVEEYHRLGQTGVLGEDDRVELVEGWIVGKVTHNPPHDATVDQANEAVRAVLPEGWRVRIQSAVTTSDSEPEPDLAVVRGSAARYISRHPGPEDIALVIEVADSSLADDRGVKARVYARARIPQYWIVNVVDRQLEVFRRPSGETEAPRFEETLVLQPGDSVDLSIEGQVVAVAVASLFA